MTPFVHMEHPGVSPGTAESWGPQLREQKRFGRSISSQNVSERPARD